MGALFAYSLYSGILLVVLYLAYKWILSGENQHRYNRVALWMIYAVALLALPLSGLVVSFGHLPGAGIGGVEIGEVRMAVADDGPSSLPSVMVVLLWIYLAGIVVASASTLAIAVKLARIISGGEKRSLGRYSVVIIDDKGIAPFSWCRYIVMSRTDWEESGEMISVHELQHLRLCHWVDLLVAQIVGIFMWYNPAAWLMREELKAVHEYQADSAVIESGVAPREYQMLLIKKAVGARFPSLANSLNHSKLKKRITMMYNSKTSSSRRIRGLVLVPALVAALAVTDLPLVASVLDSASSASVTIGKVSEKPADVQSVAPADGAASDGNVYSTAEVAPQYPGGPQAMMEYLYQNVKYPEEAMKENIEGRVVVQFVVTKTGEIGDVNIVKGVAPSLDEEAIRVVRGMARFIPGKVGGENVAVWYTLPIAFKIPDYDTKTDASK